MSSQTDSAARLIERHILVLENRLEDFRDGNKKDRRKIVNEVYKEVKEAENGLSSKEGNMFRKVGYQYWWIIKLELIGIQSLATWFHNKGWKRGKKERLQFTKKWNWRMVVSDKYRDEIMALAKEPLDEGPNQRQVFGQYSKSLQRICDGLSEDEKEECREQAAEWNSRGPPVEVQQR
jgi:hypothetical protein